MFPHDQVRLEVEGEDLGTSLLTPNCKQHEKRVKQRYYGIQGESIFIEVTEAVAWNRDKSHV
jgi:hypothetical protein